ncbi:hypothetical protein SAY86_009591 [Trapa natans]|uniref:Dof-type domain-containing protein n=1 Tax=Trapa natans TaxID=22666 RepID=A0AAN7KX12_TRANT|nr:hypothetical protein SAY86_009591 [Trapa natans]
MTVESMNPAIKLFGKRIKVPPSPEGVPPPPPPPVVAVDYADKDGVKTEQDPNEEQRIPDKQKDDQPSSFNDEEPTNPSVSPPNPKTPSIDETALKSKDSRNGKDPEPQEKALKKPDKILPCPRCNSSETKFCYYNNYNVNQPRHFCKSCQRYWTAGGAMRNVPVGAGRRKSKGSSAALYRHISISENRQVAAAARPDSHSGSRALHHHHCSNSTPNKMILSFGLNGASTDSPAIRDDVLSHDISNEPQVHRLNSFPWPYSHAIIPYYPQPPPPIWACGIPTAWNLMSCQTPSILGKHTREGDPIKAGTSVESEAAQVKKSGSVLIPKTLRIDDPDEASKSSIWATLGISKESDPKGGFFKGCQVKGKGNNKDQRAETAETQQSRVLFTNPAALSRSLIFHETI